MISKELIDEAGNLNVEVGELNKKLKGLKDTIKNENGEGVIEGNKFVATIKSKVQSRKLNQDKALKVVNKIGAKWLLKEVVDEAKLEDALATGEIDAKEFVDCVDVKTSVNITFKAKKA